MKTIRQSLAETCASIRQSLNLESVKTGLILGSGLGSIADQLRYRQELESKLLPHWPASTVTGHSGRLVTGKLDQVPVLVLQGRVHYYEGYSMEQVTFPVRVLAALGIRNLIITNAAGSLNPDFHPADLMLITDHINLMGTNPLIGYYDPELPTRFPDMSAPYDPEFRGLALKAAKDLDIPLRQGVLAVTTGPSYETAAEVRMLRTLGGDAVCMSTVPEVIVAVQAGLRILGISCLTNMATGLSGKPLSHDEVKEVAGQIQETFARLLKGIVGEIGGDF